MYTECKYTGGRGHSNYVGRVKRVVAWTSRVERDLCWRVGTRYTITNTVVELVQGTVLPHGTCSRFKKMNDEL